ncbi:MAG TPA: GNAT family N-acetyltransferase [Gemmatimonas sp.]|nr:GNAT family N-acetyltransferase [Gemmatimonas sp.]
MDTRDVAELVIRPFETADAPAVSALIATTMRRSNAADYPAERLEALIAYFTPEQLRQLATERQCLVALSAGQVVATAAREDGELLTFFVHPDCQGRGVGTRLLMELEGAARRGGVTTLRVEASLTGAAFYERRGYRRLGGLVPGTAGPHVPLVKALCDDAG